MQINESVIVIVAAIMLLAVLVVIVVLGWPGSDPWLRRKIYRSKAAKAEKGGGIHSIYGADISKTEEKPRLQGELDHFKNSSGEDLPPIVYWSGVDLGPSMRLRLQGPTDWVDLVQGYRAGTHGWEAPSMTEGKRYKYRQAGFDPEHQWHKREEYHEYYKRRVKELDQSRVDTDHSYSWLMMKLIKADYEKMAEWIIQIAPGWQYILEGPE